MDTVMDRAVVSDVDPVQRVRELEVQLETTTSEYGDLANMGAILASLLNLEEVLAALMEMAMRMVGGQVGAIVLRSDDGLKPSVAWGLDHRVLPQILWEGTPIAERTIAEGRGALLAPYEGGPVSVGDLTLHIDAVISEPIRTRADTVGCIVIANKQTGDALTQRDHLILQTLVNFASVAVENSRLLAESLEKQRLEHDLALAEQVQKTLVPRSKVMLGGASVESLYVPARGVGGDYFDVLPRDSDSFFLAIGDVSSKGMPAALLMTAVRSVVRAAARRTGSVAQIVNEINRVVCDDLTGQKEMFITFFLALIDTKSGTITYTNAGHPPPLLWSGGRKAVNELGCGGVFLGQFTDFQYTESTAHFEPHDRLLAFTDGVVEAADAQGNLYGRERVAVFLETNAALPPDRFLQMLRTDLQTNFFHADYIDDVTVVFVEFGGESA